MTAKKVTPASRACFLPVSNVWDYWQETHGDATEDTWCRTRDSLTAQLSEQPFSEEFVIMVLMFLTRLSVTEFRVNPLYVKGVIEALGSKPARSGKKEIRKDRDIIAELKAADAPEEMIHLLESTGGLSSVVVQDTESGTSYVIIQDRHRKLGIHALLFPQLDVIFTCFLDKKLPADDVEAFLRNHCWYTDGPTPTE